MKLIGAPTIADVVPSMVDTTALNGGQAPDTMFDANCMVPSKLVLSSELILRRANGPYRSQGQIVV